MPGIGHNGLTEDVFHSHLASMIRAEADLEVARKAKNAARKKAKAAGINLGELDAMRRLAEMTRPEQAESLSAQAQYLRWLRVPIGSQMSLFGDEEAVDPFSGGDDAGPAPKGAEGEAEKQGFLAGISGKPEENPFNGAEPVGLAWLKGYRDGRAKFDAVPAIGSDDDEDDA